MRGCDSAFNKCFLTISLSMTIILLLIIFLEHYSLFFTFGLYAPAPTFTGVGGISIFRNNALLTSFTEHFEEDIYSCYS